MIHNLMCLNLINTLNAMGITGTRLGRGAVGVTDDQD